MEERRVEKGGEQITEEGTVRMRRKPRPGPRSRKCRGKDLPKALRGHAAQPFGPLASRTRSESPPVSSGSPDCSVYFRQAQDSILPMGKQEGRDGHVSSWGLV